MPNNYALLSAVKADMGITGTGFDAHLLRLIERVCRGFDNLLGRHFYHKTATNYYDGFDSRVYDPAAPNKLWLPDDLLSVTTLKVDKDGDGTYELTLTVNTDYWLYPDNSAPKVRIDLNPQSSNLTAWPKGRRRVEIAGIWGYSNETESAGTLGAAISDTTGASVTMTAGHSVEVGDTLIIDSEQMYVSAVSTNTLTVVRGQNGSTAATHSNGAAVSRRRYERPIEEATLLEVSRLYNAQKTGGGASVGDPSQGGYTFASLFPAIRDLLAPYRIPVVV